MIYAFFDIATLSGASLAPPSRRRGSGVARFVGGRADPQALRRAYLKLAVLHHPDKSEHEQATAIFQAGWG